MREVTVVVPTHDRCTLLRTTLRSLLAQRGVDLEIVVVDDGSTDSTQDVVAGFHDSRLRAVRHAQPQGVSRARNRGVSAAAGEWIAFCDDDDVWAPDKLARQLAAARRLRRDWAYSGVVNVDAGLRPISMPPLLSPAEVIAALPRYNAIPGGGSNALAKRILLAKAGPFDPELRNTEDWEMWLRLSRLAPPAAVEGRLVGYRLHSTNASLDVPAILDGVRRIERVHNTRADRGRIHRWLAESSLRTGRRGQAIRHWAVAAGRGQASGVAADLLTATSRRLRGRGRWAPDNSARAELAGEAFEWLDVLKRLDARPVAP